MIAIPNMKLPPCCGKCMLQDGEICYAIDENDIGSSLSFFDLEDLRNFCIKRRGDCPLIEIDEKAFNEVIKGYLEGLKAIQNGERRSDE